MTREQTALDAIMPRPRPQEWYAEQQRLFLDAVAPLTRMKLELYSLYLPTIIMDSEGRIVTAAYPDELQSQIKQIDAAIQQVADGWTK